ncbi:DUF3301 domain-containing protein [Biformimicrobium ophioploci]|uniref:DUF3301 domain-containing protein n=1 Tax=Biformimicrobium ophioploci TaxID=3036711 RepID=A0ABQ6M2I0_9GAMM|nr:DUF3301 domain-containing protein [Microbulbifer sp. NKW57]GMG88533.1 hypothetical protein MNKW57_28540 [Microbulbifer sp. NKW57]
MYYSISDLFWVFVLFLGGSYIWMGMAAKDHARRAVKAHCRERGLQLLDDTVAQTRVRIGRTSRGHLALKRYFSFEFTSTGEARYPGEIELHGRRLANIQLAPHRLTPGDGIL